MPQDCAGSTAGVVTLAFPCSGGSDVGALADQAARKMSERGSASMYCLAGIGGRVSGILRSTEAAGIRLAIDGCPLRCASRTLEQAGMAVDHHVCVTELGFEKGKTSVTRLAVGKVVDAAERALQD